MRACLCNPYQRMVHAMMRSHSACTPHRWRSTACRAPLSALLLLLAWSLAPSLPSSASIHRHANYTLWPVHMAGRDVPPEEEVRRAQPRWTPPHFPSSVERRAARTMNAELDDQDAQTGTSSAPAVIGAHSLDEWANGTALTIEAYLESLDLTRPRTRFEHLPWTNSSRAEDEEKLPPPALAALTAANTDRRAAVSVTKLNLFDRLPRDSGDALMQHGHLIRLSNPHKHFSVFEPLGGCKATATQHGVEVTSSNAKRHRCRVATNAGFFNVAKPPPGHSLIHHCYNTIISRGGRFVQKQHSRLRSRQFTRNVHFGLTSHGHIFVGYIDEDMLRAHTRPGTRWAKDVDDILSVQERREQLERERVRIEEDIAAAGIRASPILLSQRSANERDLWTLMNDERGEHVLPLEFESSAQSNSSTTASSSNSTWSFDTLIGGAIWLVRDGRDYILESIVRDGEDMRVEMSDCSRGNEESFCAQDATGFRRAEHFVHLQAARTALGHTEDGSIILLSFDGASHDEADALDSHDASEVQKPGVTLHDMARVLISFGVVNAINLDGGGSSTVVVDGVVSNYPSDGMSVPGSPVLGWPLNGGDNRIASMERPVSSITCIHDDDEDEAGNVIQLDALGHTVPVAAAPGVAPSSSTVERHEIDMHIAPNNGSVIVLRNVTFTSDGTGSASSTGVSNAASLAQNTTAAANSSTGDRVAEDGLREEAKAPVPSDSPSAGVDADASASLSAAQAEAAAMRARLARLSILAPLLGVALLLLLLVFIYCACTRGWMVKTAVRPSRAARKAGFQHVGSAASGQGAPEQAEDDDVQQDEIEDGADALELGESSVAIDAPVSLGRVSEFAAASLDSEDNLELNGPHLSGGSALAAEDRRAEQLAREQASLQKHVRKERAKLGSAKAGGSKESMSGLLSPSASAAAPAPPPFSGVSASAISAATPASHFELGDDLADDDEFAVEEDTYGDESNAHALDLA